MSNPDNATTVRVSTPVRNEARDVKEQLGVTWDEYMTRATELMDPETTGGSPLGNVVDISVHAAQRDPAKALKEELGLTWDGFLQEAATAVDALPTTEPPVDLDAAVAFDESVVLRAHETRRDTAKAVKERHELSWNEFLAVATAELADDPDTETEPVEADAESVSSR